MDKAIVLAAALALAGCITDKPAGPVQNPRAAWCATNTPIRLPAVAIALLSRPDKATIIKHNRQGEEWCGWTP